MSKGVKQALQVVIPLLLGALLIWYQFRDFSESELKDLYDSIRQADYRWIALSALFAIFSHLVRAHRWKYPLESLNINVSLVNRFAAVMIGYLANLLIPRFGEVLRCATLSRYQKIPFEKLLGTVIAERLVDLIILIMLILTSVYFQFEILEELVMKYVDTMMQSVTSKVIMAGLAMVALLGAWVGWRFLQRSQHPVAVWVREKIRGLMDGFITVRRMKGQGWFYLHSALIWVFYLLMFQVTFYCLPGLDQVPFGGILSAFVLGGITIVLFPGGFGAYPLAIQAILLLYDVPGPTGYAFGWIVWVGQTIMIILLGLLSLVAMPFINAQKAPHEQTTP